MDKHVTPSELHAIGIEAAQQMPVLDLITSMTVTAIAVVCSACLLALVVEAIIDMIMTPKTGGKR